MKLRDSTKAFFGVLIAGVITMLAGGVEWGTPVCGIFTATTVFLAIMIAGAVRIGE